MDTKHYIDSLFADYEEDEVLSDFKEELKSNLEARVKSLVSKGVDEEEAFRSAAEELRDITVLADEISLKKKQEMIGEAYMGIRHYLKPLRVILYITCGAVFLLGVLMSLFSWIYTGLPEAGMGALMLFSLTAVAGATFLGLTQETASREPVTWKRALIYAAAAFLALFGLLISVEIYLNSGFALAVAPLVLFTLPGASLGAFLILTEKDHSKPWAKKRREVERREANERFSDPSFAKQYGLLTGALWMLSIAVFAVLTLTIGIKFSWITFLVGIAIQLLLEAMMQRKRIK